MDARRRRKVLLGGGFWLVFVVAVATAIGAASPATREKAARVQREIWRALVAPSPTFDVIFRGGTQLERGDGVLAVVDGRLERVGEVVRVRKEGEALADLRVRVAIDGGTADWRPRQGVVGVRRSQGRSFLFAVRTLLPESRWRRVEAAWTTFQEQHGDALRAELEPIASRLVVGALDAVWAELPLAFERHRAELDELAQRLRDGLVHDELQPLLVEQVWPIVVKNTAPSVEKVGRELWNKLPLMSFAVRAAADRLLEDEPVRVEARWRSFVDDEAIPTLRARQGELEAALGSALKEVLTSEPVRARTAAVWEKLKDDPRVRELVRALARELLVDNPRLHAWMHGLSEDPATKEGVRRVAEELQSFVDPLGAMLFLDETTKGINPDLAYLIRLLLLRRDAQVVHLEGGDGPPLESGSEIAGRAEE